MRYWLLSQIDNVVNTFLDSCSQEMRNVLMSRLDLLSESGNELRLPYSRSIGDGLFEIRGRAGRTRARLIYFFGQDKRIYFVHACYKDQRRLAPSDRNIALENKKRIQKEEATTNAFDYIN